MRGQDRLHGDVVLVPPVSWQLLGLFLLAAVIVAAAFLASFDYAKVTTVTGRLTGDRGIVRAAPMRAGVVEAVLVREGQQVAAGDPLVHVAAGGDAAPLVVIATEAGTVTAILVDQGDEVAAGRPMLSIVPRGTRLLARIEVPPSAAGFVEPGQPVRIAIDAFPFATYGTVEGRIETVSAAAAPVALRDGRESEAFLVTATLERDAIDAFGRARPLRPGMTVSARITTRSRSLAQWLFEPLYAGGRR
jgi:multidrug efflux pump subunit AcrA (membrane-fusion protein)